MKLIMRTFLYLLTFFSPYLFGAQQNCVDNSQTHFVGDMPKGSYEWFFSAVDDQHTQASLTFSTEINGAVFFQAIAQREDDGQFQYAFPLEVLDHPITTEAKEIEFILSNEQLSEVVINIIYLEQPYMECSDKKSYSYYVKAS